MFSHSDYAERRKLVSHEAPDAGCRRKRCILLLGLVCLWMGVAVARLASLQISEPVEWQQWALKQHRGEVHHLAERGAIRDRYGRLLAASVPAGSVFAHPRQVKDVSAAAAALASTLGLTPKEVRAKLESKKPFVWIARQLPRRTAEEVRSLEIPGVDFLLEAKRIYPYNRAASTLIGKVGLDGQGLSGLELLYNKQLSTPELHDPVVRDAVGNVLVVGRQEVFEPPKGTSITLTIDSALQLIVDEEVERGRVDAHAVHALGLLADPATGEILAMSHGPSVNFNETVGSSKELKNLVTETVFEPGSIFKPIVAAVGMELGVVRLHDLINCENGRYVYGKRVIKDVHRSGTITVEDVVVRSSNIGMTKIGIRIGAERLYGALRAFGFGQHSGFEFPGNTTGILRPVSRWAQVDVATHAFGQGVAVTPAQIVRGISALVNGGVIMPLTLVRDPDGTNSKPTARQVISAKTADAVRDIMVKVVEDEHGTGGNAKIGGLRIGGKTGTAQKARKSGRGYDPGKYVASFVGFVDGKASGLDRSLVLLVSIDEPRAKSIYGGTLAAPVFKRIMERTVRYLAARERWKPEAERPDEFLREPGDPEIERHKRAALLPAVYGMKSQAL